MELEGKMGKLAYFERNEVIALLKLRNYEIIEKLRMIEKWRFIELETVKL